MLHLHRTLHGAELRGAGPRPGAALQAAAWRLSVRVAAYFASSKCLVVCLCGQALKDTLARLRLEKWTPIVAALHCGLAG